MNTAALFATGNDVVTTPPAVFDALDAEFGFVLDAAATSENRKCSDYFGPDHWFSERRDALSADWPTTGAVFCNPPYSHPHQARFIRKALEQSRRGVTTVMLIPARTDTAAFHECIWKQPNVDVRFLRGRLKFGGASNSAPFPSMVVVFRGMVNAR